MGRVLSLEEMSVERTQLAAQGRRLVMTNGVFDLLHVGHARYLAQARSLGDALVVAMNDDDSVRGLKGPSRPIVPLADRAELLAALAAVDYVVPFGERTADRVAGALRPDIYVKGGDYGPDNPPPEAATVRAYGGEVRILPFVDNRSTSELIQTILAKAALKE
ncbi:MAG: adenylyltransferase/cytidyltransferase family protein [Anaerolineae bacterium]